MEVAELKAEPPRRPPESKSGSFKIGGRQFPADFPLLKNQDLAAPTANSHSGGKDSAKGNSLLNALKSRPGNGPALFGSDSLASSVHFDKMGTDISGPTSFLASTLANHGNHQIADLTSLLKPNIDQSDMFNKPFSGLERRGLEDVEPNYRGVLGNIQEIKPLGMMPAKKQLLVGNDRGFLNGALRAGAGDHSQHFQEGVYTGNKQQFSQTGREHPSQGPHLHMNMLKKRKPYQLKKGEAVEISDVEETPIRQKKGGGGLLLTESDPNLMSRSRHIDNLHVQGHFQRDKPHRHAGFPPEVGRMMGKNNAVV